MRNLITTVCAIAIAATFSAPALADHDHDGDHDGDHHGWRHHEREVAKQEAHHDWRWERNQYRNHWHKISVEQQKELDADMRAQWLAYHHNRWHGNYNWSMYHDPRFIDYLHTNNPTLLTKVRTYIGF